MLRSLRPAAGATAALAAALVLPVGTGSGQDRLVHRLATVGGIPVGSVRSLAQDSVGFLWIGTVGGLLRWDGLELRRWAPDRLDSWVNGLAVCPDGAVFAVEEGGSLYAVTPEGVEPVTDGAGRPIVDASAAGCDADGGLWITAGTALWLRPRNAGWEPVRDHAFDGETPVLVPGPGAGAWVRTAGGLWRVEPAGTPRLVASGVAPVAVSVSGADTVVLTWGQGVVRATGAGWTTVVPPLGRGIGLVRRGATVWAAFDRYLVALRSGAPPEVIGSETIPEGGGPLVADREGSLWMGTFSGVLHFPEPETAIWNDRHGLPSAHTRYLARVGDRIWISTWQGLGYIRARNSRWEAHSLPREWASALALHVDGQGALWVAGAAGLREVVDGRERRLRSFPWLQWDAAPAPEGGLWFASSTGLVHAPVGGSPVRMVPGSPFEPGQPVRQILWTRDGRLWLAGNERICRSTLAATEPAAASWACDAIPGAVEITGLVEMPSGAVWASSSRLGVWRQKPGSTSAWEPVPGSAELTARSVYRLRPAAGEGVWILGFVAPHRVRENPEAPAGWDVLETLTDWQGVPSEGHDVIEDPDGTLWLTTSLGLVRVPAAARRLQTAPPPVVLVSVAADGRPVSGEPVRLQHRRNRVDLRFAALSYRDPSRIRYQVRVAPSENWSDHQGPPALTLVDLPAGHHRAEVRASLDGRSWSDQPAAFAVTVLGPWYLQGWALGLLAAAIAATAYAAHRARVAVLLRLERQRTRIAMDLHDELGAGLGSIGILAGVLKEDRAAPVERSRLATAIGETASELAASLSDIVWSLRARGSSLAEVSARLAEHGARLFAGDGVAFEARFPDQWPVGRLDSATSRAVLLIGSEALYNAARHAKASRVTLSVARSAEGWTVTVDDDGQGLPADDRSTGLGRVSMRQRAAAIGARVEWTRRPEGGTRVRLHLHPRAIR